MIRRKYKNILLFLTLFLFAGIVLSQINFTDTRAAQAFKAKNYDAALVEFSMLAQENPTNPLVLRYLAITLRQLGQYKQSIEAFQKALALAPENPAIYYHLGVTYYLSRQYSLAEDIFKRVVTISPESKYAQLGHQYLTAIRDELNLIAKRQQVRTWSLYAQGGLAYDDNVSALPDLPEYTNTNLSSGSGSAYLSLRNYFLKNQQDWLGTAEIAGYLTRYLEQDFEVLDTGTYSGSIALQKTGALVNSPYIAEAKYLYQHVDINRDVSYSRSNIALLSGKLYWRDRYSGKLAYTYSDDDFSYEGADPEFTSRDGKEHKLALVASWFSADGRKKLDIGGNYHETSARGVNFDVDGYKIFVEGEVPLFWDVKGSLLLSYGKDDYPNFSGPINRKSDIYDAKISLMRWFGKRVFSSLDFGYHDESSNYNVLSYDRKKAGLTIGYSY